MVELNKHWALDVLLWERLTAGPAQFTVNEFGDALPARFTVPLKFKVPVRLTLTERSVRPLLVSTVNMLIVKSPT